jgi:predicted chitinase
MSILSADQLRQIMPRVPSDKFDMYLLILNRVMEESEITTLLRAAAYLAQLAHESGQLRFMEEIWGPTAAQKRYEPPTDLARRLGNTQPGDGRRFKGRGPIQITGRANYKRYGDLLGVDLVRNPDLAATPQIGFQISGLYWQTNGLNELADVQDFLTITKRINGGTNGLAERQKFYETAKAVLGVNSRSRGLSTAAASVSLPRAGTSTAGRMSLTNTESEDDAPPAELELPRGQEAIFEAENSTSTTTELGPGAESKKKSAGANPGTAKKPVPKKSITKGVKKLSKASTRTSTKKTAVKSAKAAPAKAVKAPAKKAAKKPPVKAAKKAAKKATKKPVAKKGAKKAPVRILLLKSAKRAAKKRR